MCDASALYSLILCLQRKLQFILLVCFVNMILKKKKKFWVSKYNAAFDYIDKTLIVLFAASGGVSVISFASVTGAPVGTASASFTVVFS